MPDITRQCRRCGAFKPLDQFGKWSGSRDGIHVYCRPCSRDLNKESRLVKQGLLMRIPKRTPTEKVCPQCGVLKPVSAFHKSKRAASGIGSWCSPCWTIYARNRYAADPDAYERRKASIKRWHDAHPEVKRASEARYRKAHPEKVAALRAQWERNFPERAKALRDKRRALVKGARVVPFTSKQLDQRMAYFGYRCWMCRGPFENVDHVKPLTKGGLHILANLRPACAHCNNVKHARWYGVAELFRFVT